MVSKMERSRDIYDFVHMADSLTGSASNRWGINLEQEPRRYQQGEAKHSTSWAEVFRIDRMRWGKLLKSFSILTNEHGVLFFQMESGNSKITIHINYSELRDLKKIIGAI